MMYAEYDVYLSNNIVDSNDDNDDNIPPPVLRQRSLTDTDNNSISNKSVWNETFQIMVEELKQSMRDGNSEKELVCYERLARLAKDFTYTATMYGKVIIAEKSWDIDKKTIKPIKVGGVAGGEKYIVNGILFKFADDHRGLYGNNAEAAGKASNHDIRGCANVFSADLDAVTSENEGIHVPLMAVINYRGWKLTAISVLPIQGAHTLVYGSDCGQVPVIKDESYAKSIKEISQKLNLKSHNVKKVLIHVPFDMEGHRGIDGRLYALDFSRLFPCQALTKHSVKGAHLFQLLRPEFVSEHKYPLSSDAFSIMGKEDGNVHNNEVVDATKRLIFHVIPNFVLWLLFQNEYKPSQYPESVNITNLMHRFGGINVRHLYLVLVALVSSYNAMLKVLEQSKEKNETAAKNKQRALEWVNIIVVEMFCRELKSQIRAKFRAIDDSDSSSTAYRKVVIEFLNKYLITVSSSAKKSWKGRQLATKLAKNLGRDWNDLIECVKKRFNIGKLDHVISLDVVNEENNDFRLKLEEFHEAEKVIEFSLGLFSTHKAMHAVNRRMAFSRLQMMLGLWFSPSVYSARTQIGAIAKDVFAEPFLDIDLVDVREVVKDLNIVAYAEGRTLARKSLDESGERARELLQASIARFKHALSTSGVPYMYLSMSKAYYQLAIRANNEENVNEMIGLSTQAALHVAQKPHATNESITFAKDIESLGLYIKSHFSSIYGPRIIRQSCGRIYGVRLTSNAYIGCDQNGHINVYNHVEPDVFKYSRTDRVPIHSSWIRCCQISSDNLVFTGADHGDGCIAVSKLSTSVNKPTLKPIMRMNTGTYCKDSKSSDSNIHDIRGLSKVLCLALMYVPKKRTSGFVSSIASSSFERSDSEDRSIPVVQDPSPEGFYPWLDESDDEENTTISNSKNKTSYNKQNYDRKIVCGLSNGNVQIWQADHGVFLGEFSAHVPSIYAISVVDHKHQIVCTASQDHTIRFWDLTKFQREQKVTIDDNSHKWDVGRIFRRNYVSELEKSQYLSLSYEEKYLSPIKPIHEIGSEKNEDESVGHVGWVVSLARTKRFIASGSFDGTIRLYRVHQSSNFDNTELKSDVSILSHNYPLDDVLKGHVDGIWTLRYLPQRNVLISGSSDSTVRIWEMQHKKCVCILTGPTSDVYSLDAIFIPWSVYTKRYERLTKKQAKKQAKQIERDRKKERKKREHERRKRERVLKKTIIPTSKRMMRSNHSLDDNLDDDLKANDNESDRSGLILTNGRPNIATDFRPGVLTIVAGSADENLYTWIIQDSDLNSTTSDQNEHQYLDETKKCILQ